MSNHKTKHITFRIDQATWKRLKDEADFCGFSVSELARDRIIKSTSIKEVLSKIETRVDSLQKLVDKDEKPNG